ncbi:MAG TPA: DUF2703 domain-containing protein [Erysipelotrichaceae bacterium]|nr:DUF2703 domain-containing protein [Erysipelotrichaceae bacterium]
MKIVQKVSCCAEGGDCCKPIKKIEIDFLYLDLNVCERCQGSDKNLDEAIELIKPILTKLGFTLAIHKVNVNTMELAKKYRFLSSPTVRINQNDIELSVKEDNCKSCGDLCGDTVDCRVFTYDGKEYHEPPVEMIIDGILRSIYNPVKLKELDDYQVPDNLLKFYKNN